MKSPPSISDDCDDIFGPPRTYPTGYCPPKTRPSMISAKYRAKEERRKVLKISLNKLKKIEDPESSLCRSVLINNTMKRLQKESRDEKVQTKQVNYAKWELVEFDLPKAESVEDGSRKRNLDEEDCDVQDVLKQFYMPPTPRLLTSIDEDEVEEPLAKRTKVDFCVETKNSNFSGVNHFNNNVTRFSSQTETDSFSCGHASLFSELQNNVYHNLIASLET